MGTPGVGAPAGSPQTGTQGPESPRCQRGGAQSTDPEGLTAPAEPPIHGAAVGGAKARTADHLVRPAACPGWGPADGRQHGHSYLVICCTRAVAAWRGDDQAVLSQVEAAPGVF